MIERIFIENFKSLRRVELTLGRMNLFIGTNASELAAPASCTKRCALPRLEPSGPKPAGTPYSAKFLSAIIASAPAG